MTSELEERLDFAMQRRLEAIQKIHSFSKGKEETRHAVNEVVINFLRVKEYLEGIYRLGLRVTERLKILPDYAKKEIPNLQDYQLYHDHLTSHYNSMQFIPSEFKRGKFKPLLSAGIKEDLSTKF